LRAASAASPVAKEMPVESPRVVKAAAMASVVREDGTGTIWMWACPPLPLRYRVNEWKEKKKKRRVVSPKTLRVITDGR
jgi:hypothetical protein